MRRASFLLFFLTAFLCMGLHAVGPRDNRITGNFSRVPFRQFVQEVEIKTLYHFYYDEKALDSFFVNITVAEATLADALLQVFQNTIFKYAIDTSHRVFITKQVAIQTALPADFFSRTKKEGETPEVILPIAAEAKDSIKGSRFNLENKVYEIGVNEMRGCYIFVAQ